jgi:hypothetical protein
VVWGHRVVAITSAPKISVKMVRRRLNWKILCHDRGLFRSERYLNKFTDMKWIVTV